jgi:mRNA-degrading endonuclease toxin of MazEF toxin-antitoxin module
MKRGEIYFANLSPSVGSEMDKRRPALIVSNDANNNAATTVTILPITSNITRIYPFEVLLNPEIVVYRNLLKFKPSKYEQFLKNEYQKML